VGVLAGALGVEGQERAWLRRREAMLVFLLVVALLEAVGRNDVAVVEPEGEGKMPEERLGPVVVDMIAVAEVVVDSAVVGPGLGTRYRLAVEDSTVPTCLHRALKVD